MEVRSHTHGQAIPLTRILDLRQLVLKLNSDDLEFGSAVKERICGLTCEGRCVNQIEDARRFCQGMLLVSVSDERVRLTHVTRSQLFLACSKGGASGLLVEPWQLGYIAPDNVPYRGWLCYAPLETISAMRRP